MLHGHCRLSLTVAAALLDERGHVAVVVLLWDVDILIANADVTVIEVLGGVVGMQCGCRPAEGADRPRRA